MADYATVEQIQSLGLQTDAPDESVWELLATAASREFDTLCEVRENYFAAIEEEATYSNRDFYGNGSDFIRLDPYTELNPVDPVLVDQNSSYSLPDYRISDGGLLINREGYPSASSFVINRFSGWRPGVKITVSAIWGWTETPADIVVAVSKLAVNNWRRSDPVNAENTESSGEPLIDGLPASVWPVVEKYREKHSQRALFA